MRCRPDAQRLARHHRNQREFAGRAGACPAQLCDLRIMDVAGLACHCVVCPFQGHRRSVMCLALRSGVVGLDLPGGHVTAGWPGAAKGCGTATTWRLNLGRKVSLSVTKGAVRLDWCGSSNFSRWFFEAKDCNNIQYCGVRAILGCVGTCSFMYCKQQYIHRRHTPIATG